MSYEMYLVEHGGGKWWIVAERESDARELWLCDHLLESSVNEGAWEGYKKAKVTRLDHQHHLKREMTSGKVLECCVGDWLDLMPAPCIFATTEC